jgi:hypothetical protein
VNRPKRIETTPVDQVLERSRTRYLLDEISKAPNPDAYTGGRSLR